MHNYKNRHNNRNHSLLVLSKVNSKRLHNLYKKTYRLYRDEDLQNFGLGKQNPQYRCDVLGSTNVTGDYYLNTYLLIPAGSIFPFAGPTAPGGYLFCDGSLISRSTYSRLYEAIVDTYGAGDGSTTFNLPDMRGRTIIGSGQGAGLSNRLLGDKDGEETHTLTTGELPSHTHTGTTDFDGLHTHSINDPGHNHNTSQTVIQNGSNTTVSMDGTDPSGNEINLDGSTTTTSTTSTTGITINPDGGHTHTFTTNSTGGDGAHNIMQPYIVINYIIRF